jgi:hypothetical protein
MQRPEIREPWLNYRVNLFIDNSKLEGAPVIMDTNYSFYNIFGGLEYENQYGTLKTDYMMIKPGLLHQANGGYIGELNQEPGEINLLAELGFFSNPSECKKCVNSEQVKFVAKTIGDELIKTLNEINNKGDITWNIM